MQAACNVHATRMHSCIRVSNAEVMPSNAMHSTQFIQMEKPSPDVSLFLNYRYARGASGQSKAQVMSA